MSKGKIIAISIVGFIVVLNIVLFGFVFRLRKQGVEYIGELNVAEEEIIKTANIKKGKSTLLLDKEKAINNIEQTYANIKVVQIKTVSMFEIKIVIRERFELYYTTNLGKHYVMDEDLKVLRITEIEPTNLIKIESNIAIDTNTKECAFLGTVEQKEIFLNLYKSVYSVVIESEEEQARIDMCLNISSVKIEEGKLMVITPDQLTLSIAKPNHDLTNKINICFSAIRQLKLDGEILQNRTIKIYYEVDGASYKCSLSPAVETE